MLVEKLFRDARASMIEDGTNEVLSLADQGGLSTATRKDGTNAIRIPATKRISNLGGCTTVRPDDGGMPAHLLHSQGQEAGRGLEHDAAVQPALHSLLRKRPGPGVRGRANHQEGLALLDDLAAFGAPTVLFSGGEPLIRPDIFELRAYASRGCVLCCRPMAR
jgi:hypothetical protein